MYPAFTGIVEKGLIRPLEKVKLKDSMRVIITLVGDDESLSVSDWKRLKNLVSRQYRQGDYTRYEDARQAKQHSRKLMIR